jgi:archaemetzincin
VGPVADGVIATISEALIQSFEADPKILEPLGEPDGAFDARRQQYSSVAMLKTLMEHAPPGPGKVVGVTGRDLFIPMLTFVFGQAQLDGRFALVSIARLKQEFYGLPPDEAVLAQRTVKETFHELGHSFGLAHCANPLCPMSLSTSIRQVDSKSDEFCATCTAGLARRGLKRKEQGYEVKLADSGR